ncbi:alpha/beta hydrolase [Sunxiuqinia sp. A32]|uniref:alpha/beta hydrolase n=1 Tax=Sunxiuqinia sp. A32 TaxID=3461496 RepID=UPI004045E101
MKYMLLLVFVIAANVSFGQVMYRDSIYSKVIKTTSEYTTYNNEKIGFDYYVAEGAKGKRPLILYIHGGAFAEGIRDFFTIADFANDAAHLGYAVASISYRLNLKGVGFGCDVSKEMKIGAIDTASIDANRAIKHMLDNPQKYAVDPDKIILIGSSAGALTVLNMAYAHKDNVLPAGFKYAGVISMAGAVTTLDNITFETAIPTQLFHGTGDIHVPYYTAPNGYCNSSKENFLMLYGPAPIAERLKGLGKTYYLFTAQGGSHAWCDIPTVKYFGDIVDFMYNDCIKSGSMRQTERIINSNE